LKKLLDSVRRRGDENIKDLLDYSKEQITKAMRGRRRFDWTRPSSITWQCRSSVYLARGKRRGVGSIGVCVEPTDGPRLVGWISPRIGGLAGRRNLIHVLKNKKQKPKIIRLASDHKEKYPPEEWGKSIIWFDKRLTLDTLKEEVGAELRRDVKYLFKSAPPKLMLGTGG
jgi:hypothetical protein